MENKKIIVNVDQTMKDKTELEKLEEIKKLEKRLDEIFEQSEVTADPCEVLRLESECYKIQGKIYMIKCNLK